ncbi:MULTISPECIES: hypothetical protein [Enterobacteriaceae]|uniref:hypothetical protein n=1 Tax=Enterobacteriaceae TaxID=543 RepID=UPI00321A04AC|nr:hypothetical protein [Salmonella enterica]HCK6408066.1 hypothetical protein [Salmonella enterica]
MTTVNVRRPSPLQRRVLIVLAGLEHNDITCVRTRDLEHLLEQGGDAPVYGPNLRASCRRMEASGWLRTLRAPNLQLAVELTDSGRAIAVPLLAAERERVQTEQRATVVRVLPLVRLKPVYASDTFGDDRPVELSDRWHLACRGDYVIRLDGTTCLQLWTSAGQVTRLESDPLQVAEWLQACHDAGIDIRLQINESTALEQGTSSLKGAEFPGGQASSTTVTWYQHLLRALRQYDVKGLSATNPEHLKAVKPGWRNKEQPLQERFLALAKAVEGTPDALRSDRYEEDTGHLMTPMLAGFGFTPDQASRLTRLIRWPLMSQEEFDRRELNSLLDDI